MDVESDSAPYPARVNITITKPNKPGALLVEAVAQNQEIFIDSMYFFEDKALAEPKSYDSEWKRRGAFVTAVDLARYSAVMAECYIATDAVAVDQAALGQVISHLQTLPGTDGYVTETFSRKARYFQIPNARRIDAIRDAYQRQFNQQSVLELTHQDCVAY